MTTCRLIKDVTENFNGLAGFYELSDTHWYIEYVKTPDGEITEVLASTDHVILSSMRMKDILLDEYLTSGTINFSETMVWAATPSGEVDGDWKEIFGMRGDSDIAPSHKEVIEAMGFIPVNPLETFFGVL